MAPKDLSPLSHPHIDFHVLQPSDFGDSTFALGPSIVEVPDDDLFPFSDEGVPIIADNIFLGSWTTSGRSLRTWPTSSDAYLEWLNRVQGAYGDMWKKIDIFDAIQLSRRPPKADNLLIASALCFWSSLTNTFLFRSGPFSPTLLDVAAITGLRPHGTLINSNLQPRSVAEFESKLDPRTDLAYTKFLKKFSGVGPASASPVSQLEHTAFLLYWLCHHLFCTRSQKINRDFVPIAVALATGEELALGTYFLSFLYRETLEAIRPVPKENKVVIGSYCGIFWFLQMCLQLYFPSLCSAAPSDNLFSYGSALGQPDPLHPNRVENFSKYFRVFYCKETRPKGTWAPFCSRSAGPRWFREHFEYIRHHKPDSAELKEHQNVWFSFLATRELHLGTKNKSKLPPSTEVYSPHFVARQFGFVQSMPAPISFFTTNTVRGRQITKTPIDVDTVTTKGKRLKRFFTPSVFHPSGSGLVHHAFETCWEDFTNILFCLPYEAILPKLSFEPSDQSLAGKYFGFCLTSSNTSLET